MLHKPQRNHNRRLWKRQLSLEQVEARHCLSTVGFAIHDIETIATHGASDVMATDVDGDGDLDVLSASEHDDKIAWYENTDGLGTFGNQQVITTRADGAFSVYAADLDGDGDSDVLSASWQDNKVAWYENTDGRGSFGEQQLISSRARHAWSVHSDDLDGDGDLDVLVGADNRVSWFENTNGEGSFGQQHVITSHAVGAKSVYAADLDGDGDLDTLAASWQDNTVAWYENTDGQGTFGKRRTIETNAINAWSVHVSDLNGDGHLDVLSTSTGDDLVAWYENTDGQGTFGEKQIITTLAPGSFSVFTGDVDGDGDPDVLTASLHEFGKIAWYENTDGEGTFGGQRTITTNADGAYAVFAKDLDGDGDLDVLSASIADNTIAWYENRPVGDSNNDGIFDSADLVMVLQANEYMDHIESNSTFDEGDWNGDGDFDALDLVFALQAGNYVSI